jgi:hypothetical protein
MMLNHSTSKTKRKAVIVALAACAALAFAVAPAEGKRLGQVAPECDHCGFIPTGDPVRGLALHTAADSPSYVVPRGRWRITSWRLRDDTSLPDQVRLLVFRRTSTPGRFRLIAKSGPRLAPPDGAISSYASSIRVRRGDRLGLETQGAIPPAYRTAPLQDKVAGFQCSTELGRAIGAGTACPMTPSSVYGFRLNLATTIKRLG